MIDINHMLSFLKDRKFRDLEGATINAEIPVSEALLNELMTKQVKSIGMVEKMRLRLPGNDRMLISVKAKVPTGLLGIKLPVQKDILLQLNPNVQLQPTPRLQLRILEGFSGIEKIILNWFEKLISKTVPGEVNIEGSSVTIDLKELMDQESLNFLTKKVQEVNIEGHNGKLVVSLLVKI